MSHDPHADPDMLRHTHAHYWQPVDKAETLYRCRHCPLTWSLDDDPDDGGRAA